MNKAVFSFLALFLLTSAAQAIELAGVNVAPTREVAGQTLTLNGAGIRTATILNVKVYVAALYTPAPVKTEKELLASKGPLRLELNFVRSVGQAKVSDAWNFQFKESNTHPYPGMDKDIQTVVKAFGPIKKFGVETLEFVNDETRIIDDGAVKATIKGREFQEAALSIWFGSKPVMPALKESLLGKPAR